MHRNGLAATLLLLFGSVTHAPALDLKALDRSIRKEPAYQGKPQYCLMVFGSDAKAQVWLVFDGGTMYVDANGNGDLTEPGEKVAAIRATEIADLREFKADALAVGERTHRKLTVTVMPLSAAKPDDADAMAILATNPKALSFDIYVDVDWPGVKGSRAGGRVLHTAGSDASGILQFAARPSDAPIIHFCGALQMALCEKTTLTVDRELDFRLGVGTPGLGVGTFGFIGEGEPIPETAYPKVEITYAARPGQEPIKQLYELKHRC